jgi:hypothetical protein
MLFRRSYRLHAKIYNRDFLLLSYPLLANRFLHLNVEGRVSGIGMASFGDRSLGGGRQQGQRRDQFPLPPRHGLNRPRPAGLNAFLI